MAVKVTKTRVECLAATPSGGFANGATRTKGTQVRLLRKATPPAPAIPATKKADLASYRMACPVHAVVLPGCPHPHPADIYKAAMAAQADTTESARATGCGPGELAAGAAAPAASGVGQHDDPVTALLDLVDEYGDARAGIVSDDTGSAARDRLAAVLRDPAALRALAEQVERHQAGNLAQGGVIVHAGRGDNEHGVPRRALTGSLRFDVYDGGEWWLSGYTTTGTIDEGDVAGAQAWAARLMADGYDGEAVTVTGWEHHRDDYGDWWEPITR